MKETGIFGNVRIETAEEKRIRLGLKKMVIPEAQMEAFHKKVADMKLRHPHMKPSRMQRKVAQSLKIKLVD